MIRTDRSNDWNTPFYIAFEHVMLNFLTALGLTWLGWIGSYAKKQNCPRLRCCKLIVNSIVSRVAILAASAKTAASAL